MTKSIHRAILEYQHSQHGVTFSPKSPLDLRVRSVVFRDNEDHCKVNNSPLRSRKRDEKQIQEKNLTVASFIKSNTIDSSSRLETVYEQEKDTNTEIIGDVISNQDKIIKMSIIQKNVATEVLEPIRETPMPVSRNLTTEKLNGDEHDADIWYTPKEYIQSKVIKNIEVYSLHHTHCHVYINYHSFS